MLRNVAGTYYCYLNHESKISIIFLMQGCIEYWYCFFEIFIALGQHFSYEVPKIVMVGEEKGRGEGMNIKILCIKGGGRVDEVKKNKRNIALYELRDLYTFLDNSMSIAWDKILKVHLVWSFTKKNFLPNLNIPVIW